jgi:hypothetical protein
MLICLWKGCEFTFEDLAAFQEHVFTKHALPHKQPQKLQLEEKQNDLGPEENMVEKAKSKLMSEDKKIKTGGKRQRATKRLIKHE